MKSNNNNVVGLKIRKVSFWLMVFLNLTGGISAFVFYYTDSPKLVHVGDKINQTGVDALIQMERDTVLQLAPAISVILIVNSILIFLLLRELKLNADKHKSVRAEDNL
jgi:hypothetical protein